MSKKSDQYDWKSLFRLAVQILTHEKISEKHWSFGGGTALMTYYNHRRSKDIDIFLRDVQLLTCLTPRLNDFVSEKVSDYTELSNFLKLKVGEQEIDFIVAPLLTKEPVVKKNIVGIPIMVESPEEIVVKKMFYRAESFKVRDVFDLAVVIKNKEDALMENIDIFRSKLDLLNSRLDIMKIVYKKEIAALDIIDHETAKDALSIVHGFIKKGLNP